MIHQEQDSKVLFEEFLQEKTFLSTLRPRVLRSTGRVSRRLPSHFQ